MALSWEASVSEVVQAVSGVEGSVMTAEVVGFSLGTVVKPSYSVQAVSCELLSKPFPASFRKGKKKEGYR